MDIWHASFMATRRSSLDSLATVNATHWLVSRDICSRPLWHSVLSPNANLKVALATERQRLVNEGWTANELTRYTFVYCQREHERVCISIECYEPGQAPLGHGSMIGRTP
jgi:hypothetical protein